ncbi:MAG: glutamine--fructose-6-phosphate transaminase (isomerizing) [Chloroflexi bacterium]|nr:glutamine--fructose-6-phosphate transaminase (isomerizing) [Chloroflexota bacterium]
MCGIVGYIGTRQAKSILLDSLSRLEYRGYDSCGVAVRGSPIKVCKDAVRVGLLQQRAPALTGTTGIGHTRWATHGGPSTVNAHPHLDCTGRIAVVHNGIISNYEELRRRLTAEGHRFVSETDTEVIPHLIEKYYNGNLEETVRAALDEIEGSYAIAVIAEDECKLVAARRDSPLVIGIGEGENMIASDVPAVLDYTNRVIYLENGDVAVVTRDAVQVLKDGVLTPREIHEVSWTRDDVQKSGYEHFMLKEIHEQPRVIRDTLVEYLLSNLSLPAGLPDLVIIACGTSYHAGLVGKYLLEELLGVPVRVELASEVNHFRRIIPCTEAIFITQSGETADVLSALKRYVERGINTLVITNVPGSSASRLAAQKVFIKAGPEVSVAATKTFLAQLIVLYQLTLSSPQLSRKLADQFTMELKQLPAVIQQVFGDEELIDDCARFLAGYNDVFFVGRGINYPVALEGALKLKEISYIHAEGYAAGELKHGPFALLREDTPVVALACPDGTYDSMLTSIKEIKARNSPVIAVAASNDERIGDLVDRVIRLPAISPLFSPVVNAVVLQLLAYYVAKYRGCPIDFPRNLAKSVTVE